MRKINFLLLFLLSFLSGCNGDTAYLFYEELPALQQDDRIYPLSLLQVDKGIDVILVIDNSGSMAGIQNNVIRNAKLFFEQFAKQQYVNWKLGIVSTDERERPYLGFETSFDSSLIDPRDPNSFDRVVDTFQEAVGRLGTNGSASEYTFYNVKRHLDDYDGGRGDEGFLRSNSHLVVIMISDEEEQSAQGFGAQTYEALNFYNTMLKYIPSNKILRFYGAIDHKDLKDCDGTWGDPWVGSEFEKIIRESNGFVISACIDNFGSELAKIGQDIAALVGLPSLLLRRRPKISTLKVFYEDKLLKPGPEELGGVWFYEEQTNTINFYNMDFVVDLENDRFRIEFDVDDGINRRK